MRILDVIIGWNKGYLLRLPSPRVLWRVLYFLFNLWCCVRCPNPARRVALFNTLHRKEIEAALAPAFIAELLQAVADTNHLEEDIIECGTFRGGSTILIALLLKIIGSRRHVYTCDTFQGHPYDDMIYTEVRHRKGEWRDTGVPYVQSKFRKFNVLDKITIMKGKFENIFPSKLRNKKFSLVFLDCDLYRSAKFCYSFLYPRIVHGGCIAIHDYEENKKVSFGISLATKEFLREKGLVVNRKGLAHIIWVD